MTLLVCACLGNHLVLSAKIRSCCWESVYQWHCSVTAAKQVFWGLRPAHQTCLFDLHSLKNLIPDLQIRWFYIKTLSFLALLKNQNKIKFDKTAMVCISPKFELHKTEEQLYTPVCPNLIIHGSILDTGFHFLFSIMLTLLFFLVIVK